MELNTKTIKELRGLVESVSAILNEASKITPTKNDETKKELINILADGDEILFDQYYVFDKNGSNNGIVIKGNILTVDDEQGHEIFNVNLKDEGFPRQDIIKLRKKYQK